MADDGAPRLPELARSLRSLGRPRDAATEAAHGAVFVPLLDARARAARDDDPAGAMRALRGAALAARIESLTRAAVAEGHADAAQVRARVAMARELLEPLRAELLRLDDLAAEASRADDEGAGWEGWIAQLRRVFAAADAACDGLATLLAARDEPPRAAPAGWLGRRGAR